MDGVVQMKHIPIVIKGVKSGLYEVYEDGRIWSNYKNGFLIPKEDKDGYLEIMLSGGSRNKRKYVRVHTVVAKHFIGEPPIDMTDPTVNHIDNNPKNNIYSNLEWTERGTNSSIRKNKGAGEQNHEAVLTEDQVVAICDMLINSDFTLQKIADVFKVSKSTINNIKRKKNWKYITEQYNF